MPALLSGQFSQASWAYFIRGELGAGSVNTELARMHLDSLKLDSLLVTFINSVLLTQNFRVAGIVSVVLSSKVPKPQAVRRTQLLLLSADNWRCQARALGATSVRLSVRPYCRCSGGRPDPGS